jgi:hypothetical protein
MEQIMEFFKQMNIATCSRASFYRLQSVFVNPIIWSYWQEMRTVLVNELKQLGQGLTVTGDGQADCCKDVNHLL